MCQYPYDIMMSVALAVVGAALYSVFYAEWNAYSVHLVIRKMHGVVLSLEMVSRLYLCPPAAFAKVTSIAGMLATVGFTTGATLGPILLTACSFIKPLTLKTFEIQRLNSCSLILVGSRFTRNFRFWQ